MNDPLQARRAAFNILRDVRAGARFDETLAESIAHLPPRDRRLAHEIAAGVLRQRSQLDLWIRHNLTRPNQRLGAGVHDVLRIGGYQLGFLDRIPPRAAVATSVELARTCASPRHAGFVNAVMRGMSRNPRPAPDGHDLASEFSHPDWLVQRWTARWGPDATRRLLDHNNRPPALTIFPLPGHQAEFAQALHTEGVPADPVPPDGFSVRATNVADLPGYDDGWFIVQDPAQRQLLEFADLPVEGVVWDACAAPGGKLMTAAAGRTIVASDGQRARLPRLRENLSRVNLRVSLLVTDAGAPALRPDLATAVLLDVPCSATGTMARHPDARWRLTPDRIVWLIRLQERLLDGAATVVQPGGLLVYLTCSIERDENADQVDRFLARHRDFHREGSDLEILPHQSGTDGGFGARLRRLR